MSQTNLEYEILDKIVREYLLEKEENTLHKYARTLQYAISGVNELFSDAYAVPIAWLVPVNEDSKISIIPSGCKKLTFVGILDRSGNKYPLSESNNIAINTDEMPFPEELSPGREVIETGLDVSSMSGWISNGYGTYAASFLYDYGYGGFLGRMYGMPGGMSPYGSYTIHHKLSQIWLNQNFRYKMIYLEGIGSPMNQDGTYDVPSVCKEALKAFIDWASIRRNIKMPRGTVDYYRKEYYNQKRLAIARLNSFGYFKAINHARKSSSINKR